MNRSFWRPFLIFALAAALLALAGPHIPGWENKVFSLKKLDLARDLSKSVLSPPGNPTQQKAEELQIASELQPMAGFLEELASLKTSPGQNLRIAYFGDSIIEGDLISGALRHKLQQEYGGQGVGLVPITSIVSGFRQTIGHQFSPNWETLSFMNRGSAGYPLGMIGYTFIPRNYYFEEQVIEVQAQPEVLDSLGNVVSPARESESQKERRRFGHSGPAWVEYSGSQAAGGASRFSRVRLFYSHASARSQVQVSHDGSAFTAYALMPGDSLQVLDLSPAAPITKIRLQFDPLDPIHLYGVSFDEAAGVFVDNCSVRGFSGMYFSAIPARHLQDIQAHLDYDLLILQYGENVSHQATTDYGYYKKGMLATVRHLQRALPGVPILLVSAHDRSIKVNGRFETSPDIPILVNTQGEVASESGCAFWNLFEAMGGFNSMLGYVQASPPLAGKDYTHFTRAGADQVAAKLHGVITEGKLE